MHKKLFLQTSLSTDTSCDIRRNLTTWWARAKQHDKEKVRENGFFDDDGSTIMVVEEMDARDAESIPCSMSRCAMSSPLSLSRSLVRAVHLLNVDGSAKLYQPNPSNQTLSAGHPEHEQYEERKKKSQVMNLNIKRWVIKKQGIVGKV